MKLLVDKVKEKFGRDETDDNSLELKGTSFCDDLHSYTLFSVVQLNSHKVIFLEVVTFSCLYIINVLGV